MSSTNSTLPQEGLAPLHDARSPTPGASGLRQVLELFAQPFSDLLYQAHTLHRRHFDPNALQVSTLCSIKTGGCPEDCAYCPQSARYDTGVERKGLLPVGQVVEAARAAKQQGATRFCMGAAWRSPRQKDLDRVLEMVSAVKALGMETCATLGMLTRGQAEQLSAAGLDYYNHNLDSSRDFYGNIITTRTYDDRLQTLAHVQDAGINVCAGGIVGMGESREDRASLLLALASLPNPPQSVPINLLVQIPGTPLAGTPAVDALEFVRTIAVARLLMPTSFVRLSAGRESMTDELQALCFFAGANSVFHGEKLLTTPNPATDRDRTLLERLGMRPMAGAPATSAEEQ